LLLLFKQTYQAIAFSIVFLRFMQCFYICFSHFSKKTRSNAQGIQLVPFITTNLSNNLSLTYLPCDTDPRNVGSSNYTLLTVKYQRRQVALLYCSFLNLSWSSSPQHQVHHHHFHNQYHWMRLLENLQPILHSSVFISLDRGSFLLFSSFIFSALQLVLYPLF
jgi:hypothetical protein